MINPPNLKTVIEWNSVYKLGSLVKGKLTNNNSVDINNQQQIQSVLTYRPPSPILIDYIELAYADAGHVTVFIFVDNNNYSAGLGSATAVVQGGLNVGALYLALGTPSTAPAIYEFNGDRLRFQLNTSQFGGATVQIRDRIPVSYNFSISVVFYDTTTNAPPSIVFGYSFEYEYIGE